MSDDSEALDPINALLGEIERVPAPIASRLADIGVDIVAETMAITQMFSVIAVAVTLVPYEHRMIFEPRGLWPFPGFARGGPHHRVRRIIVDELGRGTYGAGRDLPVDADPLPTYGAMLTRFREVWHPDAAPNFLTMADLDFIAGRRGRL